MKSLTIDHTYIIFPKNVYKTLIIYTVFKICNPYIAKRRNPEKSTGSNYICQQIGWNNKFTNANNILRAI